MHRPTLVRTLILAAAAISVAAAPVVLGGSPGLGEGGPPFAEYLGTGYLAPFVVLLMCGFGFPLPEEITMLAAGFLAHRGEVEFVPVVLVCIVATLLGDSIPYFVGRRFGRRALRSRVVRRALHPERLRSIERNFERNGLWAVFVCRFLPGVRLPAWFTAGTLGIPYHRFILVDALGAALMTPVFVALGRYSGETISELERHVEGLTQVLGFVVLALALVITFHLARRYKPRRGLGGGRASTGPARGLTPPPTAAVSQPPPAEAAPLPPAAEAAPFEGRGPGRG